MTQKSECQWKIWHENIEDNICWEQFFEVRTEHRQSKQDDRANHPIFEI